MHNSAFVYHLLGTFLHALRKTGTGWQHRKASGDRFFGN